MIVDIHIEHFAHVMGDGHLLFFIDGGCVNESKKSLLIHILKEHV